MRNLQRQTAAFMLAAGILLTGVSALPAKAQMVQPPSNVITTQGHGEVKVKPDSLNVAISIETTEKTIAAARKVNNEKMQRIVDALKALNIPNLKLETQNLSVFPIQEYPLINEKSGERAALPKTVGYRANNSVSVTVTNASQDMLGEYGSRIIDTGLNAEANNVGGLNFYLTDMQGARMQALEKAVADARATADTMARAAGVAITGLHSMEGSAQYGGGGSYPRPMYMVKSARTEAADVASVPVETGETTVTSDVTARFKF